MICVRNMILRINYYKNFKMVFNFLDYMNAELEGQVRNIYFPFDIINDTPIDVANEMVKELELTDWKPAEIASMIAREIMNLVPNWKENGHHEYDFREEAEEYGHPFYYLSSPTSTNESSAFVSGNYHGVNPQLNDAYKVADWLQGKSFLNLFRMQ